MNDFKLKCVLSLAFFIPDIHSCSCCQSEEIILGNISNVSYKTILSSAMTVGLLPSETNSLTREVVSEKKEVAICLKMNFVKKKWKLIRDVWA